MSDNYEYDVLTPDGLKVSVKCRKGTGSGWRNTSAIPKIDITDDSPTHLMFVHLNEDYTIDAIWFYDWLEIIKANRFKAHKVRGDKRSYIFTVKPNEDDDYLIFKS